jgi:hypothetical protein
MVDRTQSHVGKMSEKIRAFVARSRALRLALASLGSLA